MVSKCEHECSHVPTNYGLTTVCVCVRAYMPVCVCVCADVCACVLELVVGV